MKILVSDPIAEQGVELLRKHHEVVVALGLKPDELCAKIGGFHALVVRSETKVTKDVINAGRNLRVIGRAGVGVDNIDLDAATQKGIVVVNAPASNTISAVEHTMALMLALARQIPQAHTSLTGGRWDRAKFMGVELRGKALGIIGLGRVGYEVARRARAFEMHLLGYDPFISPDRAKAAGIEMVTLEDMLVRSDFLSVHTPLTGATRALIGAKELATMKKTARVLNVARGGIIDETALTEALANGTIAGAALDVYSKEPITDLPLFKSDKIVVTPHLGASTEEAQARVGLDIAEQIIDVLADRNALYAVNIPMVPPETLALLRPYANVAAAVGKLASQLISGPTSRMTITYAGEISQHDTGVLKAALLGGFLSRISEERVNMVNANIIAQSRGLLIAESKTTEAQEYANVVTMEIPTEDGRVLVSGTMMQGQPHIVRLNQFIVDMVPSGGAWLIVEHTDRPGMIGNIGTITGENDINISSMQVSRLQARGPALTVLGIDERAGEQQVERIERIKDVQRVRVVEL